MPNSVPSHKAAGLLVPVFALRHTHDFGIGDTLAVREAIDFCATQGFGVLQLLPIHETVGDHSPYNPISSRALAPALLALTPDEVPGLEGVDLKAAAPEAWLAQLRAGAVKQNSVQPLKLHVLLAAHRSFRVHHAGEETDLAREFAGFQRGNSWLPGYTLYRLLIREYEGNPDWTEWRPEHQAFSTAETWFNRHPARDYLATLREGYAFVQWVATRQWRAVRTHADTRGVKLMGEMSFGVGRCSADVWASRELFDLDWHLGTPPVVYFDTNKDSERWGQNWGLPAYRWENHRSSDFGWLRGRLAGEKQFFHLCRLDHLRGYFRGYMFPWPGGAVHAEFAQLTTDEARERTNGKLPRFVPGHDDQPTSAKLNELQGRELIGVMQEAAGEMQLVAELMGEMPAYMRQTLEEMQLANLSFPQLERKADRSLPTKQSLRALSLVAYGNHDHAPIATWYRRLVEDARADPHGTAAKDITALLAFAEWRDPAPDHLDDALLAALQRALFDTPCFLAVLMSSDVFGNTQRFNLPGSYGAGTWSERLEFPLREYATHAQFGPRLARLRELIAASGRKSS